jgi:hypothetical protein
MKLKNTDFRESRELRAEPDVEAVCYWLKNFSYFLMAR